MEPIRRCGMRPLFASAYICFPVQPNSSANSGADHAADLPSINAMMFAVAEMTPTLPGIAAGFLGMGFGDFRSAPRECVGL